MSKFEMKNVWFWYENTILKWKNIYLIWIRNDFDMNMYVFNDSIFKMVYFWHVNVWFWYNNIWIWYGDVWFWKKHIWFRYETVWFRYEHLWFWCEINKFFWKYMIFLYKIYILIWKRMILKWKLCDLDMKKVWFLNEKYKKKTNENVWFVMKMFDFSMKCMFW